MPALRARLGTRVGAAHVRDDDGRACCAAAGKSYLDLLALRAGDAGEAPDLVVAPARAEEVAAVLARLRGRGRGGGPLRRRDRAWSAAWPGSAAASTRSSALDLRAARRRARRSTASSRRAVVGAGTRLPELDHALGPHGLRLGHYPQSYEWATVGGCAATRSAGQASTGFGRFDDLVAAVRCVTPAPASSSPARAPGSAAGPDLHAARARLGGDARRASRSSTLRVRPLAEATRYEAWLVPSFAEGCEALRALAQDEVAPDVARLSDAEETRLHVRPPGGLRRAGGGGRARRPLPACSPAGRASPTRSRRRRSAAVRRLRGIRGCGRGAGRGAGARTASTGRTCATT